jgi:hypothetical protein
LWQKNRFLALLHPLAPRPGRRPGRGAGHRGVCLGRAVGAAAGAAHRRPGDEGGGTAPPPYQWPDTQNNSPTLTGQGWFGRGLVFCTPLPPALGRSFGVSPPPPRWRAGAASRAGCPRPACARPACTLAPAHVGGRRAAGGGGRAAAGPRGRGPVALAARPAGGADQRARGAAGEGFRVFRVQVFRAEGF